MAPVSPASSQKRDSPKAAVPPCAAATPKAASAVATTTAVIRAKEDLLGEEDMAGGPSRGPVSDQPTLRPRSPSYGRCAAMAAAAVASPGAAVGDPPEGAAEAADGA